MIQLFITAWIASKTHELTSAVTYMSLHSSFIFLVCRHFIYGLLDVVIPELVPEISDNEFQQKIKAMRTLPPFVKKATL